jgi:hypothetical protein
MRAADQRPRAGRRSRLPGCLLLAGLLGLAACGSEGSGNLLGTPQAQEFLDSTCAQQLEELYPGAQIRAIEREREGGHDVWGVELDNGREVEFDANDCELLEDEPADGDDDDDGGDEPNDD